MVRMRDVLRSVKDLGQPGGSGKPADGEKDEYAFPGAPRPRNTAPSEQQRTPPETKPEGQPATETATTPSDQATGRKKTIYHDAIEAVEELYETVRREEPFDLSDVESHAEIFIDSLQKDDYLFLLALSSRFAVASMAQQSVTTCIVAVKVGIGLKLSRDKLHELALTAMINQIGMVRVPQDILRKKGQLSAGEYEVIKQHPLHAQRVLEPFRDEYPFLAEALVQEHERWNGNGYPFGLKENEIHEFAQIIGLADTFVALTHRRHYRDNFIAYKAMQSIIARRNVDFSARMIKALIDVISIFPVHSLVKLNDGRVAKVLETNKQYPVRPVIEIIRDIRGNEIENPERVDLSREPMIYIVSPVLDEAAYA
ncbi:hypothetical protein GF324_10865 [bacterium]|nr:hypothetical protein [bacterium]